MFVPSIDPQVPVTLWPGIEYGRAGDIALPLDLVTPRATTGSGPAVIWLHGGGWYAGSRADGITYWCSLLAAQGFVVASVDYRLSGDAPFPAQIHDVKAAIRWMRDNARTYHVDPDRIGIMGHSAGGHLAALAAVTGDVPALEGDCGSPGESSHVQAAAIASPISHVGSGAPPLLIAHGTLDETVPFDQAERLHQALMGQGVPVELVPIEGGYHNWNPRPESTWPRVRYLEFAYLALRFFERTL